MKIINMKFKINNCNIKNNIGKRTYSKSLEDEKIEPKPFLYKAVSYVLKKNKELKKLLLIDFINETNGSQVINAKFGNYRNESWEIETYGCYLQDLKLINDVNEIKKIIIETSKENNNKFIPASGEFICQQCGKWNNYHYYYSLKDIIKYMRQAKYKVKTE